MDLAVQGSSVPLPERQREGKGGWAGRRGDEGDAPDRGWERNAPTRGAVGRVPDTLWRIGEEKEGRGSPFREIWPYLSVFLSRYILP